MQQWSYRIYVVPFSGDNTLEQAERMLNQFGDDGWELVSVTPGTGKDESWSVVYLKRPKDSK